MVTFRPLLKLLQRRILDALHGCSGVDLLATLLLLLCLCASAASWAQGSTLQQALRVALGRSCAVGTDNIGGADYSHLLCSEPIDAVYTWVNGSDAAWQAEMQAHRARWDTEAGLLLPSARPSPSPAPVLGSGGGCSSSGNASAGCASNATFNGTDAAAGGGSNDVAALSRYRDNGELRYSMRSLHKYAPWLRRIYLVTNGQVPSWLDVSNPRVRVVTHAEIFPYPERDLPTFSSPAIEAHLHRIPGISRRFLYFNDDVMLGAPLQLDSFVTASQGQKFYSAWEVPKCAPGCIDTWIGDGYCDNSCNSSACLRDGGDCVNGTKTRGGGGGAPKPPQITLKTAVLTQQCMALAAAAAAAGVMALGARRRAHRPAPRHPRCQCGRSPARQSAQTAGLVTGLAMLLAPWQSAGGRRGTAAACRGQAVRRPP